ncbi:hypothetical protein LTR66_000030 [Elasticomyces elasticus]|nr:hypothetical protein LTR50_001456 [Elasticomyces elasticus]KAK5001254.1 hypothetical protein LTR66_000030 [Elasticomyces elasticus]
MNSKALRETSKQIEDQNGEADVLSLDCDVSSESSVASAVSATVAKFGRIDYACNLAGVCIPGSTPEMSMKEFDKLIDVNLRGVWLCQKYQIEQMLKQEPLKTNDSLHATRGAIANAASMAGLRGYEALPVYTATKHGVIGLTRADALAFAKQHIRINAVCPGIIATPMLGELPKGDSSGDALLRDVAQGRQGTPEEVAECFVWLVSGRASYVTATTLAVNGGKSEATSPVETVFSRFIGMVAG